MSIASELSALNGYILGAYDEINTKGGTVPANKNMANLASAIGSISSGSSTTITPLSVTENGTYTAPTGTAYSPVTVNVSGGATTTACGIVTATSDGVMNIEHNLGQRPTIWGLRPTGGYDTHSYVKYEALERICFYLSGVDDVEEVSIYPTKDISSWATTNTRMYRQKLLASTVRPDNSSPFPPTMSGISANNKYFGIKFATSSFSNAFLKTGVEYFWFAIITDQTP